MKNNKKYLILLILIAFLVGCENQEETQNREITSEKQEVNTSETGHKHCTRQATAGSGINVELNYDLYYTGENINILHSEEKVMSASSKDLDTYEEAYKKIHANYNGLQYYDAKVDRGDTTVTSDIIINYDKIDIDALLDIEGEEELNDYKKIKI